MELARRVRPSGFARAFACVAACAATCVAELAGGCAPQSSDAAEQDELRLAEGHTFVVPAGERWVVDTLGTDADTVAALRLSVRGITRLTSWPARDGRVVELAKRIELDSGDVVRVEGGGGGADIGSGEHDVFARLVRVPNVLAAPAERGATRATASRGDPALGHAPTTRVVRGDTGEFALASACLATKQDCWDTQPEREVVLWAVWPDGLVVYRVEPELARGEYEVGRVSRVRARELCASWASFLRQPPRDALGVSGFGSDELRVAVTDDSGFVALEFAADTLREWVATGRTPRECERDPGDAVSELHAAVFAAAREGAACELPPLTFDGASRAAFDDSAPVIRPKR